ncbi:UNVERIFIED_CONTAM: hypothetical protein FKN15_057058 [Acipenser sinensis]
MCNGKECWIRIVRVASHQESEWKSLNLPETTVNVKIQSCAESIQINACYQTKACHN